MTAPGGLPTPTPSQPIPAPRRRFDVVVLCELNVDVILRSDDAPKFGQVEQRVAAGAVALGSSGAITAAALAALGLEVAVCGTVGDDDLGSLVLTMLTDLGVDVTHIRRLPSSRTGITVVLVRSDGDRALMTYPGTMADFTVADVPQELVEQTRHVHISSIYLQSGLAPGLADWLADRPAGVTSSLDPGWDPDQSWTAVTPALAQLNWLLPNANECVAIGTAAASSTSDMTVAEAAGSLALTGPSVVVKLGAAGALLVPAGGGGSMTIGGIERIPLDTTGAGDNFNAGFLAAVLHGRPDDGAALALGCACGAISTGGLGGTGRLAGAEEAAALAAEILRTNGENLPSFAAQSPMPATARLPPSARLFATTPLPATHDGEQLAGRTDLEYR